MTEELSTAHKLALDSVRDQKIVDLKDENGLFSELVLENGCRVLPADRDGTLHLRIAVPPKRKDKDEPVQETG
jgi:hypothetical protein